MKLFEDPPYEPDDWINPRGRVAMDYQRVLKQATWLDLLCSLWMAYHDGDTMAAKYDPPYELPTAIPNAKRINQAIKETGAWARPPRESANMKIRRLKNGNLSVKRRNLDTSDPLSNPAADRRTADKWHWPHVFQMWLDGGLDRQINGLVGNLPSPNQEVIRQELLK